MFFALSFFYFKNWLNFALKRIIAGKFLVKKVNIIEMITK